MNTPPAEFQDTQFAVHNVTRGRHNRTARAGAPTHARFKQYVPGAQARLVRSRPVTVTGKQILADLEHFRKMHQSGIIEVRTLHGQCLVDLESFNIAANAISPPTPHKLLDSAARDINSGMFIPPFEGAVPVKPSPEAMPEELDIAIPPGIMTQETMTRQGLPQIDPLAGLPPPLPRKRKDFR